MSTHLRKKENCLKGMPKIFSKLYALSEIFLDYLNREPRNKDHHPIGISICLSAHETHEDSPEYGLYYGVQATRDRSWADSYMFTQEDMNQPLSKFRAKMKKRWEEDKVLIEAENKRVAALEREEKRRASKADFETYKKLHAKYKGRLK